MMKKKSILLGIALNVTIVALFFFNAIETPPINQAKAEPKSEIETVTVPKKEMVEAQPETAKVTEPNPIEKNIPAWNERYDKVIVKENDTLASLCKEHACYEDQVIEINMLKSEKTIAGQTLFFPKRKQVAEKKEYYTIKKGDSPWIIARNCGLSVEELLKLNNLTLDTSKRIKPGDVLRIK